MLHKPTKEEQVNQYAELLKQATALVGMPSKFDEFVRLNVQMGQIEQQYSEDDEFWGMLEAALERSGSTELLYNLSMQNNKPKTRAAYVTTGSDQSIDLEIIELREWSVDAIVEYMVTNEFVGENAEELKQRLDIEIEGKRASFRYESDEWNDEGTEYQMLLIED